jgi:hypothetical protein
VAKSETKTYDTNNSIAMEGWRFGDQRLMTGWRVGWIITRVYAYFKAYTILVKKTSHAKARGNELYAYFPENRETCNLDGNSLGIKTPNSQDTVLFCILTSN